MEEIKDNYGNLLAIIVRSTFDAPGITFFTPPELSQQLAYMRHPAGHKVAAHVHNRVERHVQYTQETLVVKSGLIRVDLYSQLAFEWNLHSWHLLSAGDFILLVSGGHSIEVLEECQLIEVKQGPYVNPKTDKQLIDPYLQTR